MTETAQMLSGDIFFSEYGKSLKYEGKKIFKKCRAKLTKSKMTINL